MAQIRLLVDLPDGPWIADVSRDFPDAVFRVLTATPGESAGFALLRITTDEVDDVLDAMAAHPGLAETSVMTRSPGEVTVQIEATSPLLLLVAQGAGVPIEMPVEVANGVATLDATGAHDRLSTFGDQLAGMGLSYEVEFVQQRVNPGQLLTENQLDLLLTAVEAGYYDVPRESTLTEVAETAGIAKSTCSETLQRVEHTIVREFVEDLPTVSGELKRKLTGEKSD
ncbi:helix-turn-helix domain-containing protein [Halorubrum sp. 48-1-W]|uniref:helix-turn-helix domain-containing protein n=1 Tax=Halorubrum sp. 48-1-W TaxID=2249761 RepID=UPI000DCDDF9A|nr:helix-turn-helix domain-containing protein [Halorubrum sp. 48-1-W]RAW44113.1 helix-turn-helix domain-containing protein [Halorubrum sp. 48-1-W]